ncbi:MAG: diguanylate cyclase [Rhizobiaceae bacterium]|nr:diguanylate cyclase [Rhizobiaceae bacterium]
MVADLATGGDLFVSLWLNMANIVGAMTGYVLFQFASEERRRLRRPLSVLLLLLVCSGAAATAALAGGGAARILFGRDMLTGLEFWFVTELVNMLVVLPPILAFPEMRLRIPSVSETLRRLDWKSVAPLCALVVAAAIGLVVRGPGALALSVPALIWCALTYRLFTTALITMAFGAAMLMAGSAGLLSLPGNADYFETSNSIRLGIALMALGPLTISAMNLVREELLVQLDHAASHDPLTGALSRRALMERGCAITTRALDSGGEVAFLMIDADNFKRINDTHGHAAGDKVLVALAAFVSTMLRPADLFGRLGGEEFGILLPRTAAHERDIVAERIRAALATLPVEITTGEFIYFTVSIGAANLRQFSDLGLETLMTRADQALYGAKFGGKNRVCAAA